MRLIGRIFLWCFAVIGFGAVAVAVTGIAVAVFFVSQAPDLPERVVLRLDLEGGIAQWWHSRFRTQLPWVRFLAFPNFSEKNCRCCQG